MMRSPSGTGIGGRALPTRSRPCRHASTCRSHLDAEVRRDGSASAEHGERQCPPRRDGSRRRRRRAARAPSWPGRGTPRTTTLRSARPRSTACRTRSRPQSSSPMMLALDPRRCRLRGGAAVTPEFVGVGDGHVGGVAEVRRSTVGVVLASRSGRSSGRAIHADCSSGTRRRPRRACRRDRTLPSSRRSSSTGDLDRGVPCGGSSRIRRCRRRARRTATDQPCRVNRSSTSSSVSAVASHTVELVHVRIVPGARSTANGGTAARASRIRRSVVVVAVAEVGKHVPEDEVRARDECGDDRRNQAVVHHAHDEQDGTADRERDARRARPARPRWRSGAGRASGADGTRCGGTRPAR